MVVALPPTRLRSWPWISDAPERVGQPGRRFDGEGQALSAEPLLVPGRPRAQGKRGGILRVRGYDLPHFDPHLTLNFKTNNTLSFVYSKLVRHQVGAGVTPETFTVEPDLAERWEEPDGTTLVFHLRRGVRWHNKPPVNGRELTAEDVKFSLNATRAATPPVATR
jgi:peptide/nickel transport system substrate-binding protein